MKKTLTYHILDNEKYKKLQLVPIFDSENYHIYIDNKIRYMGQKFSFKDALERIEVLRNNGVKIEETFKWRGKKHGKKAIRNDILGSSTKGKRRKIYWT